MSTIATDSSLSEPHASALASLVAMMIPASAKYGIPGADDETIMADIRSTARQHAELLQAGLTELVAEAEQSHGAPFAELEAATRRELIEATRLEAPLFYRVLISITVQCYYRDPRVMESLGMEARPPFPEGFDVPQGDWSMLDPVRDRGPIWRDA